MEWVGEQLCAEAVGAQLKGVVREAIGQVVAGLLPARTRRPAHEKPLYAQLLALVTGEVVAEEGALVVRESLSSLAHEYRRGRTGTTLPLPLTLPLTLTPRYIEIVIASLAGEGTSLSFLSVSSSK